MAPNTPYYLSVENTTSDFTPDMFTITAWVKFNQDPTNNSWGQAKILDYTNLAYGIYEGYSLYLVSGGYLQFTVADPAGTKWISVRSPSPLSAYNWHHVAAVYSSGLLIIYVDGVMVNSIANEGKFKLPAGKVNIGSQVRKNGDIFYPYNNAYLDEISFYNEMLSDDEIKRDYDAFITRCVKLDDSVYETRPYSGGGYAYSMEKENTVRLYTYGQLEMITTTKKSCPQVGLIITSYNQAEILDITGTVIYRSALKTYSVSTPGISSRLDKYYENIPWDIVSRAAYIRAI